MIARLIDSVQALAGIRHAEAEPSEVAAEFADAFLLASDCRQFQLSSAQLAALQQLDDLLAERKPSAMVDDEVRAAAQRALLALETS